MAVCGGGRRREGAGPAPRVALPPPQPPSPVAFVSRPPRTLPPQATRGRAAAGAPKERPGLTEDEIAEIREAFNLFDTDSSGAGRATPPPAPARLLAAPSRRP